MPRLRPRPSDPRRSQFKTVKYHPGFPGRFGRAPEVIRRRQEVLAAAYATRPDRFVAGPPRAAELAAEVWINRPIPVSAVDGGEAAAEGSGADGKEGSLN